MGLSAAHAEATPSGRGRPVAGQLGLPAPPLALEPAGLWGAFGEAWRLSQIVNPLSSGYQIHILAKKSAFNPV